MSSVVALLPKAFPLNARLFVSLVLLLAAAATASAVTFAEWQVVHFSSAQLGDSNISGAQADPDEDGVRNLIEFGTGTDPWVPNRPAAEFLGMGAGNRLTMTFPRRKVHPAFSTQFRGHRSSLAGGAAGRTSSSR